MSDVTLFIMCISIFCADSYDGLCQLWETVVIALARYVTMFDVIFLKVRYIYNRVLKCFVQGAMIVCATVGKLSS